MVEHNIQSDKRALCFPINSVSTNTRLNNLVPSERGKVNASHLLSKDIQSDSMHDPAEDAFASLEIFLKHKISLRKRSLHVTPK